MRDTRLLLRRLRATGGLWATLAITALVASFAVAAIGGWLRIETAAGVQDAIPPTGDGSELRVSSRAGDQADELVTAVDGLVAEDLGGFTVSRTDGAESVGWLVLPPKGLAPDDVDRASRGIDAFIAGLEANPVPGIRIDVTGMLDSSLAAADRGVSAVAAVTPIPLLLIAAFAVMALGQLSRLIGDARSAETALLRARGLSRLQLAVITAAEGAAIALPASVVGLVAAGFALTVASGSEGVAPAWAMWPAALAVAVLATIIPGITAWGRGARSAARTRSADAGRPVATTLVGTVVVAIAAVIAVVRLRGTGSPFSPDGIDGVSVDPIAELAPLLVLVGGALAAVTAFRPAAAAAVRAMSGGRGISPWLPSRQLARRSAVFGTAIILVTLATASAVFASAYSASWGHLAAASALQKNGADARAVFDADDSSAMAVLPRVLALDGVTDAAPVATAPIRVGSDDVDLVAMSADTVADVASDAEGTIDTAAIAHALTTAIGGIPLPVTGSLAVGVEIAAPASQRGTVAVDAWLADDRGGLRSIGLGAVDLSDPRDRTVEAALPDAVGAWHLLALDASLSGSGGTSGLTVSVTTLTAGGQVLATPADASVTLSSTSPTARIMATSDGGPVPAVASTALADRLGLAIGDRIDFQFTGAARKGSAVIAATADALPGAGDDLAVMLDLPAADDAGLRENATPLGVDEIWTRGTGDADATAAAVAGATGGAAVVTSASPAPATRLAAPTVRAVWAGVIASFLLGAIAVVAITVSLAAARREETAILRALGMRATRQARLRAGEITMVLGSSLLFGVLVGAMAAWLCVGPFARGAIADVPVLVTAGIRFDLPALGWALLAEALVLALIVLADARRTRRRAESVDGDAS